jgi:hypothetical protein
MSNSAQDGTLNEHQRDHSASETPQNSPPGSLRASIQSLQYSAQRSVRSSVISNQPYITASNIAPRTDAESSFDQVQASGVGYTTTGNFWKRFRRKEIWTTPVAIGGFYLLGMCT